MDTPQKNLIGTPGSKIELVSVCLMFPIWGFDLVDGLLSIWELGFSVRLIWGNCVGFELTHSARLC